MITHPPRYCPPVSSARWKTLRAPESHPPGHPQRWSSAHLAFKKAVNRDGWEKCARKNGGKNEVQKIPLDLGILMDLVLLKLQKQKCNSLSVSNSL